MARKIVRDLIARVQGPGWSYGLARILIDVDNNAAVFVPPGNAPVQLFKVVSSVNSSYGQGTQNEGSVSWQRRGASCSFALAKCNATTQKLQQRWLDEYPSERASASPVTDTTPLPELTSEQPESASLSERELCPTC